MNMLHHEALRQLTLDRQQLRLREAEAERLGLQTRARRQRRKRRLILDALRPARSHPA